MKKEQEARGLFVAPLHVLAVVITSLVSISLPQVTALNNGLALTPPMGWLAWERYVCETNCKENPGECIDYELFSYMAQLLVIDGYRQVGYEYVNIDDCWSTRKRDNLTGKLQPDPVRFPDGASIKQLADQVHSFGLKLGIYGDCGTYTCQRFPGQLANEDNLSGNYFQLDANTFADWHIDSFKFDGCFLNVSQASSICPLMGDFLNQTNRQMLFSCSWPAYENDANLPTNWELVVEKCNLWRAFGDIEDSWKSVLDTIDWFIKKQDLIVKYHGPGHWFDADQLVIGDFGLSSEQERAQMAIWSIWASPLYMSNDLRSISEESSKILRNKWIIAVNQDKMGIFGLMVKEKRNVQVFVKPIEPLIENCPSYAIVYLDRRTLGNGRNVSFKLSELVDGIHEKLNFNLKFNWSNCYSQNRSLDTTFSAFDLYENFSKVAKGLNLSKDSLELRVNPSGVRMIQLVQDK